jgi:hypothetical protein
LDRIRIHEELEDINRELARGYSDTCEGASCLYTATDNYGSKYRASGNMTFKENP